MCCAAAPCFGHNGYHEELRHVDEQLAAKPDDATLWMQRGHLDVLHGDWQGAMIDLEKADRLAPGKLLTGYVRGRALALGGQFEAGKAVLDDFIQAHGTHPDAYVARARILLKLNRPADAAKDFAAAIERAKRPEPDLFVENADALVATGRNSEAIQVLGAGITKLGDIPQLTLKALDLEVSAGQFDAALLRVEAMRKAAPRPEPWMAKRAELLAQAGRKAEAQAAWTELRERIAAMPVLERGSFAMSRLTEQAETALAALASHSPNKTTQSTPGHTTSR